MTLEKLHDPLTGVYTRAFFEETVRKEIERFKRYGAKFSLLLLDLDHFKEVNDTLGHQMGDKVLIEIVEKLKNLLRESDIIGRWGGDEFIVLLPYTDEKSAMRVANRITEGLKLKVQDVRVGASCAFVTPKYGEKIHYKKMFQTLDELLYRAKRQGRGRVGNMLDIKQRIVIPSYAFVSRDTEYAALKKAIIDEKKRFIVVSGETGIGKSRLVSEFLKREKLKYAETRSFGPVQGIPLFSVKNLLVSLYRKNRERFRSIINTFNENERDIVGIFIPSLSHKHISEDGYQSFFLSTLAEILEKILLSFDIPILWIDDLQWLSKESLEVIKHLLKGKIRIIGTLRMEERKKVDLYINENRIKMYDVRLDRLNSESTRDLLFGIIGEEVDEKTTDFVWRFSGGIPLYIEEIINYLAQKGYLKEQDGKISLIKTPDSVPSTLEDIISYKLRNFSEDEKYVLWFISIYHNPIGKRELYRILEKEKSVVDSSISKGIQIGILDHKNGKYFFSGEVIRRIIESDIPRGTYIRFHRIAGNLKEKAYERIGVEPFEIYDHFKEARNKDRAAYWALLSGKEALNRFSPERAFTYFKEAFMSFNNEKDRKEALIGMIKSGRTAGKITDTIEIIETHGEKYLEKYLYEFYLGSMYVFSGRADQALKLLKDAMEESEDTDFKAECMFEIAWVYRKQGRLNASIEELEKILRLDISKRRRSMVLSLYGGVLIERGDLRRAGEILQEVIEEAEKTHTEYRISSAYINYALLKASITEYGVAEKYYKKAIEISEKNGEKGKLLSALNNLGTLYLTTGNLEKAEYYYMQALDLARETGNHSLEVIILNNLGSSAREREFYTRAFKFYKMTYEKAHEYGYPDWVSHSISNILITYSNFAGNSPVSPEFAKELEKVIDEFDVPTERAYAYLALVDYYRKEGNFQRSEEYIERFKKLPATIREQYEINLFISLARFYDAKGNIRMSDYYINKILKLADNSTDMHTRAELYRNAAEWYYEHKRLRKAKKLFKQTYKMMDWLTKESQARLKKKLEELNEGR